MINLIAVCLSVCLSFLLFSSSYAFCTETPCRRICLPPALQNAIVAFCGAVVMSRQRVVMNTADSQQLGESHGKKQYVVISVKLLVRIMAVGVRCDVTASSS